jgi:hypothetical protein
MAGQAGAIKRQLMVTRIAQRLALQEMTVWARLDELRKQKRPAETTHRRDLDHPERRAPADPAERQLLEMLLADAALVPLATAEVSPTDVRHPGLRRLFEGLLHLQASGQTPDLDHLRPLLMDNGPLAEYALRMQEIGRAIPDRDARLRQLLAEYRRRRLEPEKQELQQQLHTASDHDAAVSLLRLLQERNRWLES